MLKKLATLLLTLLLGVSVFALSACDVTAFLGGIVSSAQNGAASSNASSASSSESYSQAEAVTDATVSATETTSDFSITTADGDYTLSGDIYTITAAGTYVLSGCLDGQILVDAADADVTIELNGVTISYSEDSPIKAIAAANLDISAKSGTENVIKDERSAKTVDSEDHGEGAIYAKCDLKLKGSGTLVITASYNNGVHTTKDLKIQKLSLKVTAPNNAIKGNDSVTVLSGTVVAISTAGDGIKTQNTDANKSGEVRGDITVTGGSLAVYAAGDGLQAAHDFIFEADADGNAPSLTVYTGSYSGYTASGASTTSYKGIKAQNELNISAGSIEIHSYDDGLHCDYGTAFTAGGSGQGTINISGGTVTISVYSPTVKTAGGRSGPRGWGNQQTVSGADGIHADYKLNISGGVVNIDSSFEGLEANVITVSGGTIYVSGNDDGINACSGVTTPLINVTGGYLDVTVSPNGDTDGIDSNGNYVQTGGIVITRGPYSDMAAAIDYGDDRSNYASISGGTIVILGYGNVKTSGSVKSYSLSLHSSGSHTITVDGVKYTFNNAYSYSRTTVYSSVSVS